MKVDKFVLALEKDLEFCNIREEWVRSMGDNLELSAMGVDLSGVLRQLGVDSQTKSEDQKMARTDNEGRSQKKSPV